ncbi:U32 family peptidase [Anaerorhabdus sp.]|uniref:peptidase U32 family protein n=1 Tax=Anaerorhabdus sp. TaxID=1872524 RepID=UPI002B1FE970|nr:U32 family peptidase [Anaerorhabdus sp.]MEA4875329.1 U32 family peptidase [Anaerorhabdus sp.]
MNKKIELLAPAGDLERAKTAIRFGANAVYLGGKRFSLRSRASNFDLCDIKEACDYAKEHGAHIHVTVNMIPHDEDLDGLEDYLKELENAGVTAVIVASPSIIQVVKKVAPKLEVHLSTQMSTTNLKAIEYYKRLGVDRIVFARECNLEEVTFIAKNSPIPTEAFIHGGMCVNYSGRCTLSNAMTLRDANRGGCAQSCRWKYHLLQDEQEVSTMDNLFSMSSKDLMAVEFMYDLMEANVASLKIEGRMKSAYYIASVVHAYRKCIDEIGLTGQRLSPERLAYYVDELAKAENRPTSSGFYRGLPTYRDHLYGINGAGVTHDFVGVVLSYDEVSKTALVQVRNVFTINDELEVFGPKIDNESFIVQSIVNGDNCKIDIANQPMTEVRVPIPFTVYPEDMIRRK